MKALNGLATALAIAALIVPLVAPYGIVVAASLASGVTLASAAAAICKDFETGKSMFVVFANTFRKFYILIY